MRFINLLIPRINNTGESETDFGFGMHHVRCLQDKFYLSYLLKLIKAYLLLEHVLELNPSPVVYGDTVG